MSPDGRHIAHLAVGLHGIPEVIVLSRAGDPPTPGSQATRSAPRSLPVREVWWARGPIPYDPGDCDEGRAPD